MISRFRIASLALSLTSSLSLANTFISGFYSYVIEVKDPEGIRVPQKICVSLLKKDTGKIDWRAASASKYENCIDSAAYDNSGISSLPPLFDDSKRGEVGILKNRDGVESRWVYWDKPVAHLLKLKDEKGGNEKHVSVCSVPIVREEDKSIPEVASKIYTEVDPRYMRLEFCAADPAETVWVKDSTGKLVQRLAIRCPAAKSCLEEKRIKIEAKIVTTADQSTAHGASEKSTLNQQVHNETKK